MPQASEAGSYYVVISYLYLGIDFSHAPAHIVPLWWLYTVI